MLYFGNVWYLLFRGNIIYTQPYTYKYISTLMRKHCPCHLVHTLHLDHIVEMAPKYIQPKHNQINTHL